MVRIVTLSLFSVFLISCASAPEIPEEAKAPKVTKATKTKAKKSRKISSIFLTAKVRQLQQDCQIYKKPTTLSQRVSTIESGNDLWTQETDTPWYRVYKNRSYGYVSKICF